MMERERNEKKRIGKSGWKGGKKFRKEKDKGNKKLEGLVRERERKCKTDRPTSTHARTHTLTHLQTNANALMETER